MPPQPMCNKNLSAEGKTTFKIFVRLGMIEGVKLRTKISGKLQLQQMSKYKSSDPPRQNPVWQIKKRTYERNK